ncbi:MAG: hypothetical protein J7L31_04070 [Thermoplasmata archaeon]|nr:hypothetical protein [Thermoplasmata archaeon]
MHITIQKDKRNKKNISLRYETTNVTNGNKTIPTQYLLTGNNSFAIQLGYYGEPQTHYPILDSVMYLNFEYVAEKGVIESVYAEKRNLNKNSLGIDYSLNNYVIDGINISIIFPRSILIENKGIFQKIKSMRLLTNGALAPGERSEAIEYYVELPFIKRLGYNWDVSLFWIGISVTVSYFIGILIKKLKSKNQKTIQYK